MSIERTYHCDGPECDRSWGQCAHRELDMPTITGVGRKTLHFCGWDCVLRHAATKEPETIVAVDDLADPC